MEPTQHKRERAERLPLNPVATGILQSDATRWLSKATKWPTQILPGKLSQKLFISQEGGYTYFLSNSTAELLRISYKFLKDLEDISIEKIDSSLMLNKLMLDSGIRNEHFCMWMLVQLLEIMPLWWIVNSCIMMLLQISYLKTNKVIWWCAEASQVVRYYSELKDFNRSQKFDLKQVSDLFVHNLQKLLYLCMMLVANDIIACLD